MLDDSGKNSTAGGKRIGRTLLRTYLLIGIVFPTLIIAFVGGWRLLIVLLATAHVPVLALRIIALVAVVSSVAAAFWLCRKIWRGRLT